MILLECDGCYGTIYINDFKCPKDWASVKYQDKEGVQQSKQFHDRELGDCYDCWLLSPWEGVCGKDNK